MKRDIFKLTAIALLACAIASAACAGQWPVYKGGLQAPHFLDENADEPTAEQVQRTPAEPIRAGAYPPWLERTEAGFYHGQIEHQSGPQPKPFTPIDFFGEDEVYGIYLITRF